METIKQINRQSTRVDVKVFNKRTCRRKIKHIRTFVTECIRGKILQPCDSKKRTYFRTVDERPSARIRIENHSTCKMEAIIDLGNGRTVSQTLDEFQQFFIIVPSIKRLDIICSDDENNDENKFCRGKFTLKLLKR